MATITKTIGAGGDYTTISAAASAINAGSVSGASASDAVVFELIDNAAYSNPFLITANPTGYASVTLSVNASVRHDGTAGTGARVAISAVTRAFASTIAALPLTLEWLEVTTTGAGKLSAIIEPPVYNAAGMLTIRHCIFHDNGSPTTTPFRANCIGNCATSSGSFSGSARIHNNRIYNWKSGSTVCAIGIGQPIGEFRDVLVYNNTIDGIDVTGGTSGVAVGIYCVDNASPQWKNNAVSNIGTNTTTGTKGCFYANGASSVGSNNASSDSTAFGSGAVTSLVRGNAYVDPDAGDFSLASGSALYQAGVDLGTTPTGVNIDITGRDRDTEGDTWSIGANQTGDGIATSSIAITQPVAYRTYQRNGSNQADITVNGSYSGSPTAIEYQIDSGGWSTLDASPAGGAYSGTISAVAAGGHTIEVRLNNETAVTASVANVLVGDVFLVVGQSNAAGRLTNTQTYTHGSLKAAMYDGSWAELSDSFTASSGNGSPWPLLATIHMADQSVPIAVINKAEGGTAITQWWNGASAGAKWTTAKATVSASSVNGLKAVLFDQGETDAINGTAEATYNSNLDGLAGDVNSIYGCPLIVASVGTTTSIPSDAALDAIRSAQKTAWGDNASIKAGPMGYDRAGLHWESDAEGQEIAERWWLAVEQALYSGTNGRGPQITTAQEHMDRGQITVTVDKTLKSGVVLATGAWTIYDDGSPVTVSSVAYSGTSITITLAAALTGSTTTLDFASGNDATGVVVPLGADVALDSGATANLPLEPVIGQSVSAATGGGPIYGTDAWAVITQLAVDAGYTIQLKLEPA